MIVIIVTIILIVIVYFGEWYYNNVYLFNWRLRNFKSPPSVPIIGHALDFTNRDVLGTLSKYREEYGDVVRIIIGPKRQLLLISDYKFLQFVLTNSKILEKSVDYRHLDRWLGTGLLTGGGLKWKKHRQLITPTFHYQILQQFIEIFEANGDILVQNLKKEIGTDSVNIYPFVTFCTLDIICETAMDSPINAQLTYHTSEYVKRVKDMCNIIIERAFDPIKMFEQLYYFTADYQREKHALKILHGFTNQVILSRKSTINDETSRKSNGRKAFLDLLLENSGLTVDEIRQEVDTFMFAGHDTTASAISFTLFCIATNPEIQKQIYEEQVEILKDFSRPITMNDLKNMKYLELVIKETLRLYPPVPFIGREITEEVSYEGEVLPKGLTLTLFIYAIHRNPEYFPNPERFDPTRFEQFDVSQPFCYLPFSAGSRNCIGQKFAMLEMKSVVSKIVRNFHLLPSIPYHQLNLSSETVLISKNGICIRLQKRSANL